MGRKILGIVNIVAGAGIIGVEIWLWAHGNTSVDFRNPSHLGFLGLLLLIAGTSLAGGILVLRGCRKILVVLAAMNLIFAVFALYVQFLTVLLALFD